MRKRFVSKRAGIRYLQARGLTGYTFAKVGRWVEIVKDAGAGHDVVVSHNVRPREMWHSGSLRPMGNGKLYAYVDRRGGTKLADGKLLHTEYPNGLNVSSR